MSRPAFLAALLAALLLAAALAPAPLCAQDHRAVITAQLDTANSIMEAEGYARDILAIPAGAQVGLIPAGQVVYLEIELEAGSSYLISGACDFDCTDLDLRLLDAEGEVVAEDIELDDIPLLEFVAPEGRRFLLGIAMESCSDDFCFFGYQVLRRAGVVE